MDTVRPGSSEVGGLLSLDESLAATPRCVEFHLDSKMDQN